jgi:hypothetical protein
MATDYEESLGLVSKYKDEGRIPVVEVQEWFRIQKRLPTRTFQWYVKEELFPAPIFEGRNGFYSIEDFKTLMDLIRIIRTLKDNVNLTFSKFRNILRLYKNVLRQLLDMLLNLLENYPMGYWDEDNSEAVYSIENYNIWTKVFEKLEKGGSLEEIYILDIQEEVVRENLGKK